MAAVMKEQTFHGRSLEVSLWKRILHHLMEFKQTMIWLILANVVVAATDVALPMFLSMRSMNWCSIREMTIRSSGLLLLICSLW